MTFYKILVCDWSQIDRKRKNRDDLKKFGVSINNSIAFENDDVDVCHDVARLMKEAYNKGLREATMTARRAIGALDVEVGILEQEMLVVTPEMQSEKKAKS